MLASALSMVGVGVIMGSVVSALSVLLSVLLSAAAPLARAVWSNIGK